jgi:hypothetical protein
MTTTPEPTPDDGIGWSTLDGELEPTPDVVPAGLRTAVYWTALALAALGLLAVGQVDVWAPQYADRLAESWDRIDDWLLFVTGAVGVAYRPTRRR